jgi:hypothetical protein
MTEQEQDIEKIRQAVRESLPIQCRGNNNIYKNTKR